MPPRRPETRHRRNTRRERPWTTIRTSSLLLLSLHPSLLLPRKQLMLQHKTEIVLLLFDYSAVMQTKTHESPAPLRLRLPPRGAERSCNSRGVPPRRRRRRRRDGLLPHARSPSLNHMKRGPYLDRRKNRGYRRAETLRRSSSWRERWQNMLARQTTLTGSGYRDGMAHRAGFHLTYALRTLRRPM